MITELTSGCSISLVTLTIVKGWLAISWFSANKESSPPNLPNIWVLGMPLFEDLKHGLFIIKAQWICRLLGLAD